jgi:hypothetical protein
VWNVYINPDFSLNTNGAAPGTPVAVELGFVSNRTILSATRLDTALFDTLNPGKQIFGWESTSPGGTPCDANGNPCGIQIGGTNNKQLFAAVGSKVLQTTDRVNIGPDTLGGSPDVFGIPFMQIVLEGPDNTSTPDTLIGSLEVKGAASYGNNGRISQISAWNDPVYSVTNYDIFAMTRAQTAKAGDTDLSGDVTFVDYSDFAASYSPTATGRVWQTGDFTNDGKADFADYSALAGNYHPTNTYVVGNGGTVGGPVGGGSGLGAGSAVPEPASLTLIGLAVLGSLGLFGRRR